MFPFSARSKIFLCFIYFFRRLININVWKLVFICPYLPLFSTKKISNEIISDNCWVVFKINSFGPCFTKITFHALPVFKMSTPKKNNLPCPPCFQNFHTDFQNFTICFHPYITRIILSAAQINNLHKKIPEKLYLPLLGDVIKQFMDFFLSNLVEQST